MRLLASNLVLGPTTIPLVMADGPEVVFVTLTSHWNPLSLDGVRHGLARYLVEHPWVGSARIDTLSVQGDGFRWSVGHMRAV